MTQYFAHLGNPPPIHERAPWLPVSGLQCMFPVKSFEGRAGGTAVSERRAKRTGREILWRLVAVLIAAAAASVAAAQTDCAEGNGVLDTAPPKGLTVPELIQKLGVEEAKVREARTHYTYTQDVMVQTLNGTAVDGQFHEVSTISYDRNGKRIETVTF